MTDLTKQRIIELMPEIAERPFTQVKNGDPFSSVNYEPAIALADVLRAMDRGIMVDRNGIFYDLNPRPLNIGNAWKLEYDYDGQTQETKDFIGKLIGV